MVLQGALAALLSKLGAGHDIPIGTAIAGRTEAALDRLVGFFVNTLVLRTDTGADPSFIELLGRVRSACLEAYAHQELPFERLVELLDPPRAFGRQPLFQTALVLQNAAPARVELEGLEASALPVGTRTTKFDLSFEFREGHDQGEAAGGLIGELEYSADLFERASAERIAAYFKRLLEQIAAAPRTRLSRLELLDRDERHRLLDTFNQTAAECLQTSLIERFEQQVARAPEHTALLFEHERVSYAELEVRANRLAWQLIGEGIGPEDRVAICLERSVELIVALIAVLKSGAAYVPLDPDAPPERLAFQLEDAAPRSVLSSTVLASRLPQGLRDRSVLIDDPRRLEALEELPQRAPTDADRRTPVHPHHPAYLIYTSGSTGRPKGVLISQQSIAHYLDLISRLLGPHVAQMPLFTPTVFDLTLTTLFAPLCGGGTIRIHSSSRPEEALAQILKDSVSSAIKLTPSHLSLLATLPPSSSPSSLRIAIVGGEALNPAQVRVLSERCPGIQILNEYGPTESTVGAVAGFVDEQELSIGKPYPNTQVYVLDAALEPCALGVIGELYIGGVGLARGYWQRPGLTAERFIASPYARRSGERLYRSGDLACWQRNGTLSFHGRADTQLKLRGLRIEPGEIEAVLMSEPGIAQAAVIAREDVAGEPRLVAYLVAHAGAQGERQPIDTRTLRERLASRLPEAMVPAAFVLLEALPLSVNGKLDRAALPRPKGSGLTGEYLAPSTPEELVLCEIVATLLGLERVGITDHFFHLGGHSLLAVRLAAKVRERLGRELPLRTIFETPVLGDLARLLAALEPLAGESALVADPANRYAPFQLTPVQQAYWLGRQHLVELSEVACHVYAELKLRTLDVERLTAAWRTLIDRHPMLRAVIGPDGTQRILENVPQFTIAFDDRSTAPREEAQSAALAVREALSHQILPADRWPLFEVRVTRLAAEDWRLHLSLDALILDGESSNRLLQEVFDLYRGKLLPQRSSELSFRDYVLYLHSPCAAIERARAYWVARLDSLPPAPALPLAVDPARLTDPRFARLHAVLAPPVWRRLTERARAAGLTPSSLLLSAYAEVLGTWSRSEDFTLNLTVGDRRVLHPDLAGMLGVFTTLLPLEVRGACRGAFLTRAQSQQRQLVRDLDHRALSGVEVQRLLAQRAGEPRAGLLPVVFTSVLGEAQVHWPEEVIEVVHSITQTPQTWLDNKVYEQDEGLGLDWDAPAALFPAGLLETMFDAYVGLLHRLADSDSAWQLSGRTLLPASERALLARINATQGPLPTELLHEPVFAAAAAHPEAVAILAGERTLRFGELPGARAERGSAAAGGSGGRGSAHRHRHGEGLRADRGGTGDPRNRPCLPADQRRAARSAYQYDPHAGRLYA